MICYFFFNMQCYYPSAFLANLYQGYSYYIKYIRIGPVVTSCYFAMELVNFTFANTLPSWLAIHEHHPEHEIGLRWNGKLIYLPESVDNIY